MAIIIRFLSNNFQRIRNDFLFAQFVILRRICVDLFCKTRQYRKKNRRKKINILLPDFMVARKNLLSSKLNKYGIQFSAIHFQLSALSSHQWLLSSVSSTASKWCASPLCVFHFSELNRQLTAFCPVYSCEISKALPCQMQRTFTLAAHNSMSIHRRSSMTIVKTTLSIIMAFLLDFDRISRWKCILDGCGRSPFSIKGLN